MASASDRVFAIPELFCTILANVDIRTILLSQRVNRHFRTTIRRTPALQRYLFFSNGLSWKRGSGPVTEAIRNPLLVELFTPWFDGEMDGLRDHGVLKKLSWAQNDERRHGFLRKEASWRYMQVQYPPITAVGVWERVSFMRGDWHKFSVKKKCAKGLTMGSLYDLAIEWMYADLTNFRVFFLDGSDMSFLNHRPLSPGMTPAQRQNAINLVKKVGVIVKLSRGTTCVKSLAISPHLQDRRDTIEKLRWPSEQDGLVRDKPRTKKLNNGTVRKSIRINSGLHTDA